jgi:hypothetical protein
MRLLALRYDINRPNGTHFKKGSYAATPCNNNNNNNNNNNKQLLVANVLSSNE